MTPTALRHSNVARRLVWLAGAVLLWSQLGALTHHHDEHGGAGHHRATDCAFCVALVTPATPPAAVALPPAPAPTACCLAAPRRLEVPTQPRPAAHGPRAPPSLHS